MGLFTRSSTAVKAPPAVAAPAGAAAQRDGSDIIAPPMATPAFTAAVAAARAAAHPVAAETSERQLYFQQLRVRIHQQLVDRLDVQNLRTLPAETVRAEVRVLIRDLCNTEKGLLNSSEQEKLMDDVMDETFGLGPLETLLKDMTISDILVN